MSAADPDLAADPVPPHGPAGLDQTLLDPVFVRAEPEHAAGMVEVIHAAFGARPALDPPSTAIDETPDTVAASIRAGAGIYATVAGRPAGSLLLAATDDPRTATFQRVSVHPDFQQHGIASAMVGEAEVMAAERGSERVELYARKELPELIGYWRHRGFAAVREDEHGWWLARSLPLRVEIADPEAMHGLGRRLAGISRPGDVMILSGALGAGKTTLTQGIGAGLGSDGPIISPTFVISRVHPSATGRPTLVHVDAYRLGTAAELDDLGLDAELDRCVTVIEWGEGLAEMLTESRLEIAIDRTGPASEGRNINQDRDSEPRTVWLDTVGERWDDVARAELARAVREIS